MNKSRILLVGLGPHAKRIYIKGLRQLGESLTLIVDLQSQKEKIESYIKAQGILAEAHFIPDTEKDHEELSTKAALDLDKLLHKHQITHAILSTEPKAHYAYLQYLIQRKIPTLTDKPITCPINVSNDEKSALKIRQQYELLLDLIKKHGTQVFVQCQRRYDPRYQHIQDIISGLIKQYGIPVQHIQIYHSDGSLYTPDEMLERENHPYKYGYGKLFTSGYHFIDLLSWLPCWEALPSHKRPTAFELQSSHYSPDDQLFSMNEDFYHEIFQEKSYKSEFDHWEKGGFQSLGEVDFTGTIQFLHEGRVLSTCSVNLLHSGFSRRSWSQQALDTYKGNGRVRHESITLSLGPLLSIQVHSYQSCETKDRDNSDYDHDAVGGLDHYQIYIFRNIGLIGGKPVEVIEGKELFSAEIAKDPSFIGYNEAARDRCLSDFLEGVVGKSQLVDQKLTIDLVTSAYISIARKKKGISSVVECSLERQTGPSTNPPTKKEFVYESA